MLNDCKPNCFVSHDPSCCKASYASEQQRNQNFMIYAIVFCLFATIHRAFDQDAMRCDQNALLYGDAKTFSRNHQTHVLSLFTL